MSKRVRFILIGAKDPNDATQAVAKVPRARLGTVEVRSVQNLA
jgi:hypothetical protein